MEILLTDEQLNILQSSIDFNILSILQTGLKPTSNLLLLESAQTIEELYSFCCESDNQLLIELAETILKNDRNVIKPININSI